MLTSTLKPVGCLICWVDTPGKKGHVTQLAPTKNGKFKTIEWVNYNWKTGKGQEIPVKKA